MCKGRNGGIQLGTVLDNITIWSFKVTSEAARSISIKMHIFPKIAYSLTALWSTDKDAGSRPVGPRRAPLPSSKL